MANLTNAQKALIEKLNNADEKSISGAISAIERAGGSFVVSPLVHLFMESKSQLVREQIYQLFCALKDQDSASTFVKSITAHVNNSHIHLLVSACWQSSLDYSTFLNDFLIFIEHGDIRSALEATTVITENLINTEPENRKRSPAEHDGVHRRRVGPDGGDGAG